MNDAGRAGVPQTKGIISYQRLRHIGSADGRYCLVWVLKVVLSALKLHEHFSVVSLLEVTCLGSDKAPSQMNPHDHWWCLSRLGGRGARSITIIGPVCYRCNDMIYYYMHIAGPSSVYNPASAKRYMLQLAYISCIANCQNLFFSLFV